MHDTVLVYA